MTYYEMKESVVLALANLNNDRLSELKWIEPRWFDDIIEELEEEMNISLKKYKG